eukprot:s2757_g20.t1
MVPLVQANASGLQHDCSTWDELYEDDDGELVNAWSGPTSSNATMPSKKAKTMASSSSATVLSDVANALIPGAEVVLRMNVAMKFRSALSKATFWKCEVYVEMLSGILPRIAENEVLGFNVVQNIARLRAHRLYSAMCLPLLRLTRMMSFRSSKSPRMRSMRLEFVFFQLLANDALIALLFRDRSDFRLKSRSRDCVK